MATDDFLIPIDESDTSEMCTQSSNKFGQQSSNEIGPQVSSPSNFNTHTEVEVIEDEIGNSILKPRTKSLEEDPYQLCQTSSDVNDWTFYKVPHPQRQANEKAYEPNVISIGPHHHGKERLKPMEVIKRDCFSRMIEESNVEPEKFLTVMKELELEKQFRNLDCFDSDTFLKMILFDGCFIVLLFQNNGYLRKSLGKLKKGIRNEIYRDLLLLENQLPVLVLSKLYGMINIYAEKDEFPRLALSCLLQLMPGPATCLPKKFPKPKKVKHLLGLVHSSWLPSARKRHDAARKRHDAEVEAEETKGQRLWKFICCGKKPEEKGIGRKGKRKVIRCATELEEAGINFVNKGKELQASLFDIDFTDDGKLKIPTLIVEDNTERILLNFMAYEQFPESSKPTYVSDYVTLMGKLINSGKDVQLLHNCGIIDNSLDDVEVVAQMFKKLVNFTCTPIDSGEFYYAEIFDKVNDHYKSPWNIWQAKLKRRLKKWKNILKKDYFNSPWSIIKLLAAFVLLLLAGVQTVYSVLSYYHPK